MADKTQIRAVFNEALERTGVERQAYLDGACHGDVELRVRVERLLAAAEKDDPFLASPTAQQAASSMPADGSAPIAEGPGTWIGPYKLLQQIGQGGFGVVFMAEQQSPVVRRVALKIIKLGMDTRALIARFEQERQALALMDHPNIAKVLDAGATQTGRPYFVMELVRGEPITDYCDKNNLSTQDRLELFVTVCHAVQHAHQKGIIHRDIKPSNVLVTVADGRPIPKVIDFGIAKATLGRLTEKTVFTEHKALIGTPEYMSPEQAEMSAVDIDTRSDIYSLGVLLYELLTGTTPFDGQALRGAAFGELQRIIREVEPPKPSTRVSTLKGTLPTVAANRQTEPRKLGALIRGDLDWIVMRCLEKDRVRRYDTANGLASDVQRHLAGEAVLAAPPSAAYRARKFVKRNKGTVIAAMLVALALVLGLTGTAVAYFNMLHQKTQAEVARTEEQKQRTVAEKARARAEKINVFVQKALRSSDPNQCGKQSMLVADAMMQAVTELDAGTFADDPETEAYLRATIGTILLGNGRAAEADRLLTRALQMFQQLDPVDPRNVAAAASDKAKALDALGRAGEAEPYHQMALDIVQRLARGDDVEVASALSNLALSRLAHGRAVEAEPLFVQALEMSRRLYAGDHPAIAISLGNLARVREMLGRVAEAEQLQVQALEMNQRLHAGDDPELARNLNNLGFLRLSLRRPGEAEPLLEQALAMNQRLFAGDHPRVAGCFVNLAHARELLGRAAEAEPLYLQGVEMYDRLFDGDHPELASALQDLAAVRESLGRAAEAEPNAVLAAEMYARLSQADDPQRAKTLHLLARIRETLGRAADAETSYAQALDMYRRLHAGDHRDVAIALEDLADVRQALDRPAEAEELFVEALAMFERLNPDGHREVARVMGKLGVLRLVALGRPADAERDFERALVLDRRLFPDGHPFVANDFNNLGRARETLGRLAEAEALYREALDMQRRLIAGDHPNVANTLCNLARCLASLGKVDEAIRLAEEGAAMAGRTLPESDRVRKKCESILMEVRARVESGSPASSGPRKDG